MPLHHVQVELWHIDMVEERCYAVNETDPNGRYTLEIASSDLSLTGNWELGITDRCANASISAEW